MLRNLRISGFRGLRELTVSGLRRVNLLVGTNNCGKTSVLEALYLLAANGSTMPLWWTQLRRGEVIDGKPREPELAHLFSGHQLVVGREFRFEADTDDQRLAVSAALLTRDRSVKGVDDDPDGAGDPSIPGALAPMWLEFKWVHGVPRGGFQVPVTRRGSALERDLTTVRVDIGRQSPVIFLPATGLDNMSVVAGFERIVLTPNEDIVLQALRMLEPGIERIASVGSQQLAIMIAGERVPIGSMGEGIWRLLGVALALASAKGGVLLVDEIDLGLHYSIMTDMWRLVLETARKLDVQVFATTHSRDCYEALAAVSEAGRDEISLQRIERGKVEAVSFSEAEIRQAAERGLEVR